MADDFVHLHTHSHNSAFDGLGKPSEFAEKAASLGQPALALTEHGTIRGLYEATLACEAAGVKLIPGAELYLADNAALKGLTPEEKADLKARPDAEVALKAAEQARRERDHVTVWALDDTGLRNLYRLTAWSWGPGYYYKPRVDLDRLIEHSEGLAVSSGCPNGVVARLLRSPTGTSEALARARRLAECFGDRFLVEVMPHVPEPDCASLPAKLVRLADAFGATLVATQDAHYPHEHDAPAQEALLCVHTRSKMDDPERFQFDAREYWMTTRPELHSAFRTKLPGLSPAIVNRALDNTVAFAERCTAKIDRPKPGSYLVAPPLPSGVPDYNAWLLRLAFAGAKERLGISPRPGDTYGDRLMHELRTIYDLDFARYFVAVWEVRAWARANGILCGPGRGSGAGSLVCYLLRITDLDPILHGLSFERFLAPGRVDLPDIDLDFESVRRQEVVAHLRATYGEDRVAHISTSNTLGGKGAARDLARIFSVPEREVLPVLALVSDPQEEEDRNEDTLARVLADTDVGRTFAARYPDVAAVAGRLEGQLRSVGLHAAGVVTSRVPLADVVPLETRKGDGDERVWTVAYDMHGVEALGFVKLDVLGLTALTMLGQAAGGDADLLERIDLEDPETLAAFTELRFGGVFQYDTPSSRKLARGFVFKRFADVAVLTALNRPGPMKTGLAASFIQRAQDPSRIEPVHPIYDRVMADTYGVPVYQEQIVALARGFGYTPEEADKLRKKIAKKLGLSDEEGKFVAGATEAGMDPYHAQKLFGAITNFGTYAFNKAHATCYGALAVWCMWLKVHRPAAFFAAAMQHAAEPDAQMRLAAEARSLGIPVLPPDVNLPGAGFSVREVGGTAEIVGSVGDLKGIGEKTAASIAAGAPYTSLVDFRRRGGRLTVRVFETLAQAGALRSLCPHHRFLAQNAPAVWEALKGGMEPEPPSLAPYSDVEEAAVVGAVWPVYATLTGRTAFDGTVDSVRALLPREVVVPGDIALALPGPHLVLGMLSRVKLFAGDDGTKSGRLLLTSSDGAEAALRCDPDTLEASAQALSAKGKAVVALVWTSETGSLALERAWPAAGLEGDPSAAWLRAPSRTRPSDIWTALGKVAPGDTFAASGEVARLRWHKDRSGRMMATMGLLSQAGYLRVLVFSRRAGVADLASLAVGARIACRVERLPPPGLGACLTDAPVTPLPV